LQFSEYCFFGKDDEVRARELAKLLKIRIEDPLGKHW